MTGAAALALWSHWRRRPGQLAALLTGLMLATALWSGVQAINAEARRAYDTAAATLGQASIARLVRSDGLPVSTETYLALRRMGYLVSPVIEADIQGLTLIGIDPLTAPAGAIPAGIVTDATGFDAFAGAVPVLFVSLDSADSRLFQQEIDIVATPDLPPATAIADIAHVARLAAVSDPAYLLVAPDQPFGLPPLAAPPGHEIRAPGATADLGQLTSSFHLNLTAFGLLSFGVGLFIAHGAIGLAFEQRRPMIRTLRALGLPLHRLIAVLAAELLLVALLAGAAGVALGYLIAAALLPGVAGTLRGLYGAPVGAELGFDPVWAGLALLIAVTGAAIAGASALWRVAQMPILVPALPRAWAMDHHRRLRLQAGAALACAVLCAVLATVATGLVAAFAAIAALLLAAALALPALLSLACRLMAPLARGAFAEWVLADTRQQIPGLSLALMALLLALSASIGVSTMVGSFRTTFTGWLDQRLAAELYVRAETADEAARLTAILAADAAAVLPTAFLDRPILGAPGEVLGLSDHATYRDAWPFLTAMPDAWDHVHQGTALLINEQLALRHDLAPGDSVPVLGDRTLPVAGIYSDYGNPNGQIVLGMAGFRALFPDAPPLGLTVRIDRQAVPGAMQRLRDAGLPDDRMTDQAAAKALSLRVFERTFRVTDALAALTLGVAGLALLIAFLTLAQMRLPQLAPLWALGQTRNRLAGTEFARALLLAALTYLAALPVGLALAWLLLNRVNTVAFGWQLPMVLFPGDWLRLAALAALAAGLAALWPAIKLARMAPAKLLQVFAHER